MRNRLWRKEMTESLSGGCIRQKAHIAAEGEKRGSYFPLLRSINLPIIGASSIEIYQTARQQDFPGGMYVPDRENAG